jgi:hypothetical protein
MALAIGSLQPGVGSRRTSLLPLLLLLLAVAAGLRTAARADDYLPPLGGGGGTQFKALCGDGQNLAGFDLRTGADIDAVRPVCVYGSGLTNQGPGGARYVFRTDWFGTPGARTDQLLCPPSTPIVLAMHIVSEGIHTITVNNIALYCGQADTRQKVSAYPQAIFDAPNYVPNKGFLGLGNPDVASYGGGAEACPAGEIAIGLHGRSGVWVDAMGLICGEPRLPVAPVALGRTRTASTPPGPAQSICARAADAHARKSPVAASLDTQCLAFRAAQAPVALGRVDASGSPAAMSICERADDAEARKSPLYPELERQCFASRRK